MAQFCPKCGKEIKPGSRFCSECGNAVETTDLSKSEEKADNLINHNNSATKNGLIGKLQAQKTSVQIIVAIIGLVIVFGIFSVLKSMFKGTNGNPQATMNTYGKFCADIYNNIDHNEKDYYKLFGKNVTGGKAFLKEINRSHNLLPQKRGQISYATMTNPVINGNKVMCGVVFYDKSSGKIYYEHIMVLGKQSSGEYLLDGVVLYNGVRDKKAYQSITSVLNANVEKALSSKDDNNANTKNQELYNPKMTSEEIASIILSGKDPEFKYNFNYNGVVKHAVVNMKSLEVRNNNTDGSTVGFLSVVDDEVVVATIRTVDVYGYDMGVKTATLLNAKEVMQKFEKEYEEHSGNSSYDFYVVYKLLIKNDSKGKDSKFGKWEGTNHYLPVRVRASLSRSNYRYPLYGSTRNAYTLRGDSDNLDKYTEWLSDNTDWDLVKTITRDMMLLMSKINNKEYGYVDKYAPNYQNNKATTSNSFKATPSPSDKAFKKTVGTITGDDVNVRKGPGVNYKSLGFFYKGDKVRVVDSNRNSVNETWYKIEFDNPTAGLIVGWVRSDFVKVN